MTPEENRTLVKWVIISLPFIVLFTLLTGDYVWVLA